MTQLRPDAAYIRTQSRTSGGNAIALTTFDEEVCKVLTSAHTVTSVAKTMTKTPPATGPTHDPAAELESRVAASMLRLLEAERIELSPDS